jgi:isocitrate/isopropylmalate dehydrogenase
VRQHQPACIEAARAIEAAVDAALLDDALRTADLGGRGGTRAFGDAVAATLRAGRHRAAAV